MDPTVDDLKRDLRTIELELRAGLDGLRELQFEASLRRSLARRRVVNLRAEFPLG